MLLTFLNGTDCCTLIWITLDDVEFMQQQIAEIDDIYHGSESLHHMNHKLYKPGLSPHIPQPVLQQYEDNEQETFLDSEIQDDISCPTGSKPNNISSPEGFVPDRLLRSSSAPKTVLSQEQVPRELRSSTGWYQQPLSAGASKFSQKTKVITDTPKSYKQALSAKYYETWWPLIQAEREKFDHFQVLSELPQKPPPHAKVEHGIWVFEDDGVKKKARFVINGKQNRSSAETDTFSPVMNPITNYLITAVGVQRGWKEIHTDIKSAFIQANKLPEPKYTHILGEIYARYGNLYGTDLACRRWFETVVDYFVSAGYDQSKADPCMFSHTYLQRREKKLGRV